MLYEVITRTGRPVDDPMIARKRHGHTFSGHDGAILDDGHVPDSTDRQNAGVRRIDNGRKVVDPEHSEITRRERRALHLV